MFLGKTKKNIVVLPSSGISAYLGRSVGKYILLFIYLSFLKKHPKAQNLGVFSTFFLKKVKKHTISQKFGAFLTTFFFLTLFLEMGRSPRATQHFFFLGLIPQKIDDINLKLLTSTSFSH